MAKAFILFAIAMMLLPSGALAGPVESPGDSAVLASDTNIRVVRYDYTGGGLLLTDDGGASWRVMCNRGIAGDLGRETTSIVFGPDAEMYAGVFDGMWRGDSNGCNWEKVVELDGMWVKALANHPNDPSVVYAITSTGGDVENGIYRKVGSDGWAAIGSHEAVLIRSFEVAELPGAGLRFYESIARGTLPDGQTPNYIVRYSDDDGDTWTEFPFGDVAGTLSLIGVDPNNADRLALSVTTEADVPESDEIYVSADAGETWQLAARVAVFTGAAFGPDGQLWFGDLQEGLFELVAGGTSVDTVSSEVQPRCVEYHAALQQLGICELFQYSRVDPGSGEAVAILDFMEVEEFVTCDGETIVDVCEPALGNEGWCGLTHYPETPMCDAYGFPGLLSDDPTANPGGFSDAGSGRNDADAGAQSTDSNDGCGCSVIGVRDAGAGGGTAWMAAIGGMIGWVKRRRAHRHTRSATRGGSSEG